MLASHSFPLYGHSPPAGFLAEYSGHPFRLGGTACGSVQKLLPSRHSSPSLCVKVNAPRQAPRPCLRPGVPAPPAGTKKKVIFADDHGLALTQVRVMWEPSHVPPHWSLRPAAITPPAPQSWQLSFSQPASDYVDFRRRINDENVSLENVIIKEKEGFLTGTVKVKNIGFHKEVLIRWSADNWVTSEDAFCTYVDTPVVSSGAYTIYDTFSFRVMLPVASNRLDFCVCFRCQEEEHWDSNGGSNYTVSRREEARSPSPPPAVQRGYRPALWSEYAAWHGSPSDVPYW